MLSCLVWTRGIWVFSFAACSCPVLHMAGDLYFAGHVLVFCFVWAHGFCLSFLCAVCSVVQRQLSLPNLFHKEHGCPGPRVAQPSALCFPPNCSATAGTHASQGATAQNYSNNPPLEEPAVAFGVIPAARSSPVADPLDLLSQANSTLWHPRPELWALHVWLLNGSLSASESVF